MKFAKVDNIKSEPKKGLTGVCLFCGSPVIAKCGQKNIHHWSHKGKLECDYWWENETEWHRKWKDYFPENWQEIIQYSDHGEKHIADIMTDEGWVIEFQNSFLSSEERQSRNDFYKKLIWVFNGEKYRSDSKKIEASFNKVDSTGDIFRIRLWGNNFLNKYILKNSLPFFDMGDSSLYLILPKFSSHFVYIKKCSKEEFIKIFINESNKESLKFEKNLEHWLALAKELDSKIEEDWRRKADLMHEQFRIKNRRVKSTGLRESFMNFIDMPK